MQDLYIVDGRAVRRMSVMPWYIFNLIYLCVVSIDASSLNARLDAQDSELLHIKELLVAQGERINTCDNITEYLKQENRMQSERLNRLEAENAEYIKRYNELFDQKMSSVSPDIEEKFSDVTDNIITHVNKSRIPVKTAYVANSSVDGAVGKKTGKRAVNLGSLTTFTTKPDTLTRFVGFYASISSVAPYTARYQQMVRFDRVFTNVGNAYDSGDGHFTAPIGGLYFFSATVVKYNAEPSEVHFEIVKNGEFFGYIYARGDYQVGSRTVMMSLHSGDVVWLRHQLTETDRTIFGYNYASFSGALLSPY